jgi:hypothetical protein
VNNLDALYRKAGEKATRAVYERAAVAAGYTTDSNGPPMMTPFGAQNSRKAGEHVDWKDSVFGALSKTKTAAEDEPEDTNAAPRDAYDSPRIRETELFRRTQADTWRNLRPGQPSPFDIEMDELASPGGAFNDDPDLAQLRLTLARWSDRQPRLRTSTRRRSYAQDTYDEHGRRIPSRGRCVAFDAATEDAPACASLIFDYLQPEQTLQQALQTLGGIFGDSGYLAGLRLYFDAFPPSSLVREIPNKQCVSSLIARMEQNHHVQYA